MKWLSSLLSLSLFVAVFCDVKQAHAISVTTFTSRADWLNALGAGGPSYTVDFNDVSVDTSFAVTPPSVLGTPFDAGPFSLQAFGQPFGIPLLNKIDTEPFEVGGGNDFEVDGTPYALMAVNFGTSSSTFSRVVSTFDTAVSAWGADFRDALNSEQLDLELFPGDPSSLTVPVEVNSGFFGFVSDSPISVIHFKSRKDLPDPLIEAFGMDNVSARQVPDSGSTLILLAGACIGLAGMAHHRLIAA